MLGFIKGSLTNTIKKVQWIRKRNGSNSKSVLAWIVTLWKCNRSPSPRHTLQTYLDSVHMLDIKTLVSFIVARGYLWLAFNAFPYTIHWAMYTALKWCGRLDVVPLALACVSQCFLCMVLKSLQNSKKCFNEFYSLNFIILNMYNFSLPCSFYLVIYFHILYLLGNHTQFQTTWVQE